MPNTDWDYVNTPVGRVTMPGFDKARALTDAQLAHELNNAAFIDPAMHTEARSRRTLAHYYKDGEGWIWGPTAQADPNTTVSGPAYSLALMK